MKILWFSNSPAAAFDNQIKGSGGWMAALDKYLQITDDIDLHVAFLYPYNIGSFVKGKTTYHPIFTGNIIIESVLQRVLRKKKGLFTKEYLKVIESTQPDLIHIHGTENTFSTIINKTNVPIVISIQGCPSVYSYKFRNGFHGCFEKRKDSPLNLKSIVLGRKRYYDDLTKLISLAEIERAYLPAAKYIIGRTDWDRRISRVLAPSSKYFIGNEVLRDVFYQNRWNQNQPSKKLIIHTTSGNKYYKGFETLCYALSLLNNMGLEVEWRVAGVSNNSKIVDITRSYLKEYFPKKGLRLLGEIDAAQLVNSLMESHLYVMPSHIENSPNSLCEAMILGMPCIATLAGGTDSLLINKKNGIIIQDGDPWSMAGAILELKTHWEVSKEYGQNARETALLRHNRDNIVLNLVNIYKTVLNENTSSLSI